MKHRYGLLALFLIACTQACTDVDKDTGQDSVEEELDLDGDGFLASEGDCEPEDASAYPGATEFCDGVDNDCDGETDESDAADASTWYEDVDGDGYGTDQGVSVDGCDPGTGYAGNKDDCDDANSSIYPEAPDRCDGLDNDCDGLVDEDVKPGWTLMSVDSSAGYVFEIDRSTGATVQGASIPSSGMTLNTMDVRGDGYALVQDATANNILSLNACTGEMTYVGNTGVGNMCGISFGPNGDLFGLDTENDQFVKIDPATGAGTVVGPLDFELGNCGLAYDCSKNLLFGANAYTNRIHTLDPVTGQSTGWVQTEVPFASVGLEFDPSTGLLLAATGSALYTVDPSNGDTIFVGPLGGVNIDDLALHPVCTE
jgi:hypothetical protein